MYIIMYKYSTFKIKRKSFRSSMSKNFTVIPGLLPRHPRLRPGISYKISLSDRMSEKPVNSYADNHSGRNSVPP